MIITVLEEKQLEVKYCQVKAQVRHWEDSIVNGVDDEDGTLTPCREGELWCPLIDVDTGIIVNWEIGKTADVHFKVCDGGSYYLMDKDKHIIKSIEDDYVPNNLIPGKYGDYIIMTIDENGKIENWNPDFSEFTNED